MMREMKQYCLESEKKKKGISYIQQNAGRLTGLVTTSVETVIQKHITERKVEGTRRQGRRRKQLLNILKEERRNWNLKEEVLGLTL